MSAGVNVKPVSQNHSSSGIPLPRSMSTFSKQNAKYSSSGLVGPPGQFQPGGRMTSFASPTSSIAPIANSKELLKEASSRLQYQQQKAAPTRASLDRMIGSRSAYSSPQIPKRNMLRSKDTLDLQRGSLPHETLRELARNGNKNWRSGQAHFRSLDNGDVQPPVSLQVQEDTDASSLDDVSDCSSDSMEVCCEDLGKPILKGP
ncbi:uncharacterized protein LOC118807640 [Colossoma macropomum]|uniref:uncharacterized protein LOC118807640 n=1 Tax=Colossoma macropomum TaxID=42526 RepID=UPI001863B6B2|nr:uncharacterized protein LOC118807640 [Colossoma macropomum]